MKKTLHDFSRAHSYGKHGDLALLILRFSPALIMAFAHGWGKLTNFGERAGEFYNFLGLGSVFSLSLVVFAEFICSLMIILGLLTRFATIPLIITMLVIIFDVHAGEKINEFETPLLYLIIFISLLITGAGKHSLDYKLWGRPVLKM